ncbi:MAG: SDR family oxidoreductase [Dehalococcoidia bacterium]
MSGLLENRVSVVTGGSRGIGKAIAAAFLREGSRCVIAARSRDELGGTRRELAAIGPRLEAFAADVGAEDDVRSLIEYTLRKFGRIDVLVNCAGVLGPIGPTAETDAAAWWDTLRVNLLGTFLCVRYAVPRMLSQGRGKVINLSGGGATSPLPRFSAYACSKAAVVRLTETLAEELKGTGIDVNTIAPGAVNTRLLDDVLAAGESAGEERARKLRQLEDGGTPPQRAAELAVFLASENSDGLTGRLISAVWDDWPAMAPLIPQIMSSDLYTLRRVTATGR